MRAARANLYYEVGDRVRLKVLSRYDSELSQAIYNLPNKTATIKQVNSKWGQVSYDLEEINWEIGNFEIACLVQGWEEIFEPIKTRFEILDIR